MINAAKTEKTLLFILSVVLVLVSKSNIFKDGHFVTQNHHFIICHYEFLSLSRRKYYCLGLI